MTKVRRIQLAGRGGGSAYKVETKLQRAKGRYDNEKQQVGRDVVKTLP